MGTLGPATRPPNERVRLAPREEPEGPWCCERVLPEALVSALRR